jgi:NUMOD3 motif
MRKPKSAEACEKMSKAKKGKPSGRKGTFIHSDKTKAKIGNTLRHVPKSLEFKEKLTGRKLSESHKENISKGNLGKKQSLVICPHCQKQGGSQTMPRWHFDRCKSKGDLK